MAWIYLFLGGLLEIGWAVGMKMSDGFTKPWVSVFTLICIIISFVFFTKAMKEIAVGTAYAIFTGIGAAGTAIIGMTLLNDEGSLTKVFFVSLLVIGIIGLKITESASEEQTG